MRPDPLSSTDGADEWRYTEEYVEPHGLCCNECKQARERTRVLEEAQLTPDEMRVVVRELHHSPFRKYPSDSADPEVRAYHSALNKFASLAAVAVEDDRRGATDG